MTKAKLTLPNGTEIQIEGTPEEVKNLLELYAHGSLSDKKVPGRKRSNPKDGEIRSNNRAGPIDLIRELINEQYFKAQKRSLSDIQKKLEEGGHIYAQTSLSMPLTRLTRSKELRRLKENKVWAYVV